MDAMDDWGDVFTLLKQKPRFRRLVESPRIAFTWSLAYEFDYLHILVALVLVFADRATLWAMREAEDKQEFALRLAEVDDDSALPERVRTGKALLAIGLLMAVMKSLDCMALYSVPMSELVARARKGDTEALIRAVRVDPAVLSSPSVAHRLSLAVMRRDRRFLKRVKKAFDGPHKGLYPYKKLRYSALLLDEAGALTPSNREHVFDVVANQLKLYEQSKGDPFKGLFTQFSRWKSYATT